MINYCCICLPQPYVEIELRYIHGTCLFDYSYWFHNSHIFFYIVTDLLHFLLSLYLHFLFIFIFFIFIAQLQSQIPNAFVQEVPFVVTEPVERLQEVMQRSGFFSFLMPLPTNIKKRLSCLALICHYVIECVFLVHVSGCIYQYNKSKCWLIRASDEWIRSIIFKRNDKHVVLIWKKPYDVSRDGKCSILYHISNIYFKQTYICI